jgi:hypothetical protein
MLRINNNAFSNLGVFLGRCIAIAVFIMMLKCVSSQNPYHTAPALSYESAAIICYYGIQMPTLAPVIENAVDVESYSIAPLLPKGLVFDETTGIISGIPDTVMSATSYTITASNSYGKESFVILITIRPGPPTSQVSSSGQKGYVEIV